MRGGRAGRAVEGPDLDQAAYRGGQPDSGGGVQPGRGDHPLGGGEAQLGGVVEQPAAGGAGQDAGARGRDGAQGVAVQPDDVRGRSFQHVAVGRDPDHVVHAAAGGPAAGGAAGRVRDGLDARRQPGQFGAGRGRHPEGQGGDGDPGVAQPLRGGRHFGQGGVDGGQPAALRPPGADQAQRALDPAGPALGEGVQQVHQHRVGWQREFQGSGSGAQPGQVFGPQPGASAAQVHGLEQSVAAQHTQVVPAQHRLRRGDDAPAEHGDPRCHHDRRA